MSTSDYKNLIPTSFKDDITSWIKDDVPPFDYGGYVVGETPEVAILYGKSPVNLTKFNQI